MKVEIRKATLTEIPDIVRLGGQFIRGSNYRELFKFNPSMLATFAEQLLGLGVIFVAIVDGKVVGMLCGMPYVEPYAGVRILDELAWWVDPEFRKGTIGPRLLRAFEQWGRQKQLAVCRMIAPAGSEVGRFYERSGYSPTETAYVKRLT